MPEVFLTRHAIKRYQERVADVPAPEIWRRLDSPTVRLAIDFGARFVRLAGGQRLVLESNRVVTVLPAEHPSGRLARERDRFRNDEGGENGQG